LQFLGTITIELRIFARYIGEVLQCIGEIELKVLVNVFGPLLDAPHRIHLSGQHPAHIFRDRLDQFGAVLQLHAGIVLLVLLLDLLRLGDLLRQREQLVAKLGGPLADAAMKNP